MKNHSPDQLARDVLTRGLAIVGLLGIALIHTLDAIPTFSELPYKGWLYLGLILAAISISGVLVHGTSRGAWAAVGVLAASAIIGFVYSRTVGLPGAAGDIGNWAEPLGDAALFVEAAVLMIAAYAFSCVQPAWANANHHESELALMAR